MTLALAYPDIGPIAFEIGPLVIRWYALAYIVGLLLAWRYCRWLTGKPPKAVEAIAFDDFLLWATFGVIIGGRLGYVLFYKPAYFLWNPAEILVIWQGGMSFHGGLLGVIVAMYLFTRRHGIRFFALTDIVACAAPIGLLLGRIANFVNGELYGRATDAEIGMIFPQDPTQLPRHPSQLYEAGLEGLVLFLVLFLLVQGSALTRSGLLSGTFLIGYGLSRIIVEFFREPDDHLGFLFAGATMGQLLSLPMMLLGIGLAIWSLRQTGPVPRDGSTG
ncbi:prolipoprotein diacylglyceryl transferase [Pelagibius sp. Alg239-R121]|uniref:prolipoprotein diacylglyceryl transferase n=1 Tax=Pelagibius sp. Alg239-R121 TaxID=2993448 RepID=UPI0024A74EB5|nr:prolipoprotein diacylglyceryl transferase [Pelagibius sp. Alg239-R121]